MKFFSIAIALVVAALVGSADYVLFTEISDILDIVRDLRINVGGKG